jgi:hypothetical protein
MTTSTDPDLSFVIELLGMPEAFAPRRIALGNQFIERVSALYGSEDAAAGALHAYLDSGDIEEGELPWPAAHDQVVAEMGLPPGARFRCELWGVPGARLDGRTGQPVQPYTVLLQDAPSLPSAVRLNAERRYAAALDQALGGCEATATVYRAWLASNENEAAALDKATAAAAQRWPKAAGKAIEAGFYKLGEIPGAHFELRLARGG